MLVRFLSLSLLLVSSQRSLAFAPSSCSTASRNLIQQPLNVAGVVDDTSLSVSSPSPEDSENVGSVEFPPPLSKVDRLKRATTFWSTALPIVASYYGLISRLKLQELLSGNKLPAEEEELLWKGLHASGAEKLADTIQNLKGFYVKVCVCVCAVSTLESSSFFVWLIDES